MEPKDVITLLLSVEAFLLAAMTVAVTVIRTQGVGENIADAHKLMRNCKYLAWALSLGALGGWLDIYARCAGLPDNFVEGLQAVAVLAAIGALPVIVSQVAQGAD